MKERNNAAHDAHKKRHEGRFRLTESYVNLSMQMLSAVKVI